MKLKGRAKTFGYAISKLSKDKQVAGRVRSIERGPRYLSFGVRLRNELDIDAALKLAEPLALATNVNVVIAQRERGLVVFQFELARGFWQVYTRADLKPVDGAVGVGLGDGRRQVNFSFDDAPHALVAGTTGSGKTETVRSILAGLFASYAPDALRAVIVDPHQDYRADFWNVAHLAYPIATTPDEADAVLGYAASLMKEREQSNRRDGRRLLVVVDEAETILADRRRLAMVRYIAEGRKWRVNLVVASQKPTQGTLPDLPDKLNNRWVGLVSDGRLSAYLTGQAGVECHKLTGSGDFMHLANNRQDRLLVALAARRDLDRLPRAEVRTPDFEPVDYDIASLGGDGGNGSDGRGPGRPSLEPDPEAVAYYLWFQDKISIAKAGELLGLSKRGHYLNRDFARKVAETIMRIRREKIAI